MSIFYQILEQSKANAELIGVWNYNDGDNFWCGHVIDYNAESIQIQHYTKYGKKDGVIIAQISDIQSVDFDDDYARAMRYVIDNSDKLDPEEAIKIALPQSEDWQFEILKQLEGNFENITSIEINDSGNYSGFIQQVSDTDFVLQCVGALGEDEGKVIYKIDDVTGLKINDIENRKRNMLYKWRNG